MFACVTSGGTCCGATCYDNMKVNVSAQHTLLSPNQPGKCGGSADGAGVKMETCPTGDLPDNMVGGLGVRLFRRAPMSRLGCVVGCQASRSASRTPLSAAQPVGIVLVHRRRHWPDYQRKGRPPLSHVEPGQDCERYQHLGEAPRGRRCGHGVYQRRERQCHCDV